MSDTKKKEGGGQDAPALAPEKNPAAVPGSDTAETGSAPGYKLVNVEGIGPVVYVTQTGRTHDLRDLKPDEVAQLLEVGWPHIETSL